MKNMINSTAVRKEIDKKKNQINKEIWKVIDKEMAKHKIFKKVN